MKLSLAKFFSLFKAKHRRLAIQFLLFSMLIVLCGCMVYIGSRSNNILHLILFAFFLMIGGWLILAATHRISKKPICITLLFIAIYIGGVSLYYNTLSFDNTQSYSTTQPCDSISSSDNCYKIIDSINHTLSIFFPSRGDYNYTNQHLFKEYQFLHLISYLFFAMLAFSIFGRRLLNRNGRWFIPPCHKNIFWDYSDGGLLLAKDILSKTVYQQVIFILPKDIKNEEEKEKTLFDKIDSMGAIALYKDFDEIKRTPKAHHHFFLTEDQDINVKMALKVIASILQQKKKSKTHLFIRTEMEGIDDYFTRQINNQNGLIEIHLINQSDLTARRFIQKHPTLDMPDIHINTEKALVEGNFNILQLGFGWTGQEVLSKIICNSQFIGSTFKATLFDKDIDTKHGIWFLAEKECMDMIQINPAEGNVGSRCFFEWLQRCVNEFNRIVVALGDDAYNIEIALLISRLLKEKEITDSSKRIFAHVRNVEKYSYYKTEDSPISIFGSLERIYTIEVIINEKMDILAKQMNYDWAGGKDVESAWQGINIFSQDSSRAAAEAISNTLRLLGLRHCDKKDAQDKEIISEEQFKAILQPTMNTLAENEHRRWNAFHYTKGVHRWDFPSVSYETFVKYDLSANQVKRLNRHAALVPYDHLEELDKKVNDYLRQWNQENASAKPKDYKNFQENDRKFIRDIPNFLEEIQHVIISLKNK